MDGIDEELQLIATYDGWEVIEKVARDGESKWFGRVVVCGICVAQKKK